MLNIYGLVFTIQDEVDADGRKKYITSSETVNPSRQILAARMLVALGSR
jgi:hypothetical protein